MSKKDDSVFQVSLTEIAFTLVLLMLLLLGHRLVVTLQEIEMRVLFPDLLTRAK